MPSSSEMNLQSLGSTSVRSNPKWLAFTSVACLMFLSHSHKAHDRFEYPVQFQHPIQSLREMCQEFGWRGNVFFASWHADLPIKNKGERNAVETSGELICELIGLPFYRYGCHVKFKPGTCNTLKATTFALQPKTIQTTRDFKNCMYNWLCSRRYSTKSCSIKRPGCSTGCPAILQSQWKISKKELRHIETKHYFELAW